jgi:hypothetical protein
MAAARHANVVVDPLTHEAYVIEDACIARNFGFCVPIPYEAFERLAHRGCSAETLLDYINSVDGHFHFNHVCCLKLRGAEPGTPRHVWALRVAVELDPHVWHFNEGHPLGCTGRHMGRDFLWLWPPSTAFHAYLDYKEQRRRRQLDTHALDAFQPSMTHASRRPGAVFSPSDLEGAARVPWNALTVAQRFFASCIEPQPTHLQPRQATDTWTSKVGRADQRALRTYRAEQEPAARLETRLRQLTFWMEPKPASAPAPEFARRFVAQVMRARFAGFDWPALPEEIAHRIACTALASAMVADATACADAICTLRGVSRALRATADGFVGITLRSTTDAARALCIDNSATSPLHTGMRTRGIGLNTRLAMILASTKHRTLEPTTVAAFPAGQAARDRVPCWQIYLRIRTAHEERSDGTASRCARSSSALVHTSAALARALLAEVGGE